MLPLRLLGTLAGLAVFTTGVLFLSHCGSTGVVVNSYIASSNKGDLATFNFTNSVLNISWVVTHPATGVADKTLTIAAACAAADTTYGSRDCTVTSSSCTAGALTRSASDAPSIASVFRAVEAPGVGLMVLTPDSSQLFVGITAGSCAASVTGTYLALHLGVGQNDLFTLFKPNATFDNLARADFRMTGLSNVSSATLNFNGTGSSPHASVLTGTTCSNGIRTFTAGAVTMSATLAQNGLFIIDQPAGQGGLLAFDVANAATITDLANKTLHGIAFPDNGTPLRMQIRTGAVTGSRVALLGGTFDTVTPPPLATYLETFGSATTPFIGTAVPATYSSGAAYAANPFATPYPNLSTVPGLFHIPEGGSGDHGNVIAAAMKVNGKVLMFGGVWNDRASAPAGVTSVPTATAFPNTGAFIAFEN